ncbi:hypothetical protein BHE74_00053519, partial [Ensete ventricosum]
MAVDLNRTTEGLQEIASEISRSRIRESSPDNEESDVGIFTLSGTKPYASCLLEGRENKGILTDLVCTKSAYRTDGRSPHINILSLDEIDIFSGHDRNLKVDELSRLRKFRHICLRTLRGVPYDEEHDNNNEFS